MIVLFVLIAIGIVFFGYWIMSWLDSFFNKGGFTDSPVEKSKQVILIYGTKIADPLLNRLETLLRQQGLSFCLLTEPHVPAQVHMVSVLALSDKDQDNLLLCHEAKHFCVHVYTIALCNNQLYKQFFLDAGINQVLTGNQTAEDLILLLNKLT